MEGWIFVKFFLLKVLTGTILISFLVFCHTGANAAQITKTLDDDTRITPPGVIAASIAPEFKKGTVVTLNEYGEVIEGTLASKAYLACVAGASQFYIKYITPVALNTNVVPWPRILEFREGTKVTFNTKGEVVKGTISNTANHSVAIPLSQNSFIILKPFTEVSFYENGMLVTCTILLDTYLRPVGWQQNLTAGYTNKEAYPGFVEFKKETQIELNEKGEVVKGTLNKDTKLLSTDGLKVYEASTMVEFDDKGIVVKASK
jgi:hypothetical protein